MSSTTVVDDAKSWVHIVRISLQNAWRWRWRLLTIALLVALSFSLHILYGAYMRGIASSGTARTTAMKTEYYDLLVIPQENQVIKTREELPTPRFQRKLYGVGEAAAGITVDSRYGTVELLGLQTDSVFFQFTPSNLKGRALANTGEILLPRTFAEQALLKLGDSFTVSLAQQFERRSVSFTLVGIYSDDFDLPPALVRLDDAYALMAEPKANRYLINYDRLSGDGSLNNLVEWMAAAYPNALLICDNLPSMLSRTLLSRIMQPGSGLLVLIFAFMGIGVLTVALMTFLERRKEIAAMKSIGVSNGQMVALLGLEYGYSMFGGLSAGVATIALLYTRLPWLQETAWPDLRYLGVQALFNTLAVLIIALAFPTVTARVATVNQLLFARTIPLLITRIVCMQKPEGWLVLREQEDNVRILRFPLAESSPEFVCLKQVGDTVKRGEVVGTMETLWGLRIWEWIAWCDGTVTEITVGGIFVIRPNDPETSFYPYPSSIIQAELEHQRNFDRARKAAQDELRLVEVQKH